MNKSDEMDGELVGMGITHDNCPDVENNLIERIDARNNDLDADFHKGEYQLNQDCKATIEALQDRVKELENRLNGRDKDGNIIPSKPFSQSS